MDGQRQYPAEPDRWLQEQADDERGFLPGQRALDRYAEPERYAEPDSRYADEPGRRPYGEPQYASDERYDTNEYADPAFGEPPFADPNAPRRRRPARPTRVGKRSGLDLPEAPHDDGGPDEAPYHRAAMIDRQSLRREGGPAYQAQRGPGFDEPPPPPQAPAMIVQPLHAPTQAIPTGQPPAAVYLARRPGVAALIGVVTAAIELLLVPVLFGGLFSHGINAGDVLGGIFGLTGVPMVAVGLYALARGAATAHGPDLARAWMRPPLAYLPIGLILLIAAGMAA